MFNDTSQTLKYHMCLLILVEIRIVETYHRLESLWGRKDGLMETKSLLESWVDFDMLPRSRRLHIMMMYD